jgi:hypothetical protein
MVLAGCGYEGEELRQTRSHLESKRIKISRGTAHASIISHTWDTQMDDSRPLKRSTGDVLGNLTDEIIR